MKNFAFKYFIFTCMLLICNFAGFAQFDSASIVIEKNSYPQPSVSNMINWADFSVSDWEINMNQFDFGEKGEDRGCIYYSSRQVLENGVYWIAKCPENTIKLTWRDFTKMGISQFEEILEELKPHYYTTDQNGNDLYLVRQNNDSYEFFHHKNDFETINVKKIDSSD